VQTWVNIAYLGVILVNYSVTDCTECDVMLLCPITFSSTSVRSTTLQSIGLYVYCVVIGQGERHWPAVDICNLHLSSQQQIWPEIARHCSTKGM